MNTVVAMVVLLFLGACYCLLPGLVLLLSRRFWRQISKALFLTALMIQIFALALLYNHPIVTFAETIPQQLVAGKTDWVRGTLGGPWAGFYSSTLPLLAYRFHVTALSDDYVAAEIDYFPAGSIAVEWDRSYGYNITKPLR